MLPPKNADFIKVSVTPLHSNGSGASTTEVYIHRNSIFAFKESQAKVYNIKLRIEDENRLAEFCFGDARQKITSITAGWSSLNES